MLSRVNLIDYDLSLVKCITRKGRHIAQSYESFTTQHTKHLFKDACRHLDAQIRLVVRDVPSPTTHKVL